MSDKVEFYKTYSRKSKTPWDDLARVIILFNDEEKSGIYLQVGNFGFNGLFLSENYRLKLPEKLQLRYADMNKAMAIFHYFVDEIEEFCRKFISKSDFISVFGVNQNCFFTNEAKKNWQQEFDVLTN